MDPEPREHDLSGNKATNRKVAISLNDSTKNRPPWPHVVARVLPPLHAPCAADGSHRSVAGPGGRGAEEPTGPLAAWGSGETTFWKNIANKYQ